ncbi:winged helix-turn-helix transcriptional regulator [uncultured Ellagibacter sp.]|uniref:LexA family protein n=1 Tax=uncultured Ellagibacter sp. TaxID=2137580 RepID=UPI002630974B|nr:helix-turn-helix domain-containing protein [uncultured Ellagibacter sp.]
MVSKAETPTEGQREHLTPMQERLLGYIAFRTVDQDGTSESKRQLAEHLHSSTKTVDRAITRLCNEGYIEVKENLLPDGRQGANTYRLIR